MMLGTVFWLRPPRRRLRGKGGGMSDRRPHPTAYTEATGLAFCTRGLVKWQKRCGNAIGGGCPERWSISWTAAPKPRTQVVRAGLGADEMTFWVGAVAQFRQ